MRNAARKFKAAGGAQPPSEQAVIDQVLQLLGADANQMTPSVSNVRSPGTLMRSVGEKAAQDANAGNQTMQLLTTIAPELAAKQDQARANMAQDATQAEARANMDAAAGAKNVGLTPDQIVTQDQARGNIAMDKAAALFQQRFGHPPKSPAELAMVQAIAEQLDPSPGKGDSEGPAENAGEGGQEE